MPDLAPLRPGDPERVREYRLTARLGEGGQGTVYLGESPDGARVAVKLLRADLAQDEEALERFVREVSTTQRVSAFCTAAVLDTGVDQSRPYIVSEYIDGPTLDAVVAGEGPRTGSSLHRLAIGTVTALVAIHQAGIVHRDFKPSNVLLASDGPRVIDFGIAKALDRTSTLTAMAIGTPAYMTPEQLAGEAAGSPADMFAWGCTMVFAATGQPPFGTDSLPAIFNRIMNVEPDLSALTDPALRELVGQCLAKDASRRPTASEALMRLLGHTVPSAPGTPPPAAPQGILMEGVAAAQQTGPEGYAYRQGPGGYPPHQTGPGGFPPHQTGPGGFPQPQGQAAFQQGPGGYPPHQTGPGGFPPQGQATFPGQPYGGPSQGASPYGMQGQQPGTSGGGGRVRRVWVAVASGLVVALIAVGVTLLIQRSGGKAGEETPGPTPVANSGGPSATPTPVVAAIPQADRQIKLPGSSITVHESDKDPIRLTSYTLTSGKNFSLYAREHGGNDFAKNDDYYDYTVDVSGAKALGTDRKYSADNYFQLSIIDRAAGTSDQIKITKYPVYPTLPQWSPDGKKALVTLYELEGDKSNPYGFAVVDVATKKAKVIKVREKDAGTWSYFWRGDGRAVGTWALAGKTQRIRFYDPQSGVVLQTLLDVGTPLTVEGDDINPSGTLLMTHCKGATEQDKEICVWSTTADAEPKARVPFDTKRLVGWYDDQHIVAWQQKGSTHEAVVIDFKGQVKRVLAVSTNAKEYEQQFMRYTRVK
ncbi:protein kinase [Planobispora siamensis]|uniref:Protein kinase domain-containing protein n=1 Tax=Planobispora siamensis TaxID=936338 RepID=A0A8J3SL53_9ACTN|nr:serine/threonine-protein kinase [Planobispora siamensis]GIH94596.1 hypothetical protein Psi01_52260 [Planobispora siamensis]